MIKKLVSVVLIISITLLALMLHYKSDEVSALEEQVESLKNQEISIVTELKKQQWENFKLELQVHELQEQKVAKNTIIAKVTAYSPLDDRNGINSSGNPNITATGMAVSRGVVAVDPRKIPYGTKLKIEGFERTFVAGDTGGALRNYDGHAIDIMKPTYEEAIKFGVQHLEVEILE